MIELNRDALRFSFPEVHPSARLTIDFQRTLRIPDDGREYPLPPGLGRFPIRHVDDLGDRVPTAWRMHGGVVLPMYQSEALWINFSDAIDPERGVAYPFAVKIATGKVSAVTGEAWRPGLRRHPQDYLVVPGQPWLDGFVVARGVVRQFVAMPLGAGYTAEEQITGKGEYGGLQIMAYPMKREAFERRFPRERFELADRMSVQPCASPAVTYTMGIAPGGRMRQEVYDDPFSPDDWDTSRSSRCFVHLANSLVWRAITGTEPPGAPPTAAEYTRAGLPWFDYYGEGSAVEATRTLEQLRSVLEHGRSKGDVPLPENESVEPTRVVPLRPRRSRDEVREGAF
jgi:hypothetical protein